MNTTTDITNNNMISVIIPVYNVDEFLRECVNSVISQNYRNIEVILVNDGSTDRSGSICIDLAMHDSRIKVINQKNGGLSHARNVGTEIAKGTYVFYLDSDDFISKDCLAKLHEASVKFKAEIVQSNFYYDYPDHLLFYNKFGNKIVLYSREKALDKLIAQEEIKNFAWGKLIKADIAKRIIFPKNKYFEDTVWMYQIMSSVVNYVIVGKPMLFYLQRGASISGSFSIRNLDQLELNAERLKHIANQDSLSLYNHALKVFNNLILKHQSIINSQAIQIDRNTYQKALDKYIKEFKLKKRFPFQHIVLKSFVLSTIISIYKKVEYKLLRTSYWVTIQKENIKN